MATHHCISSPCSICFPQLAAEKINHYLDMESYWQNENAHLKDQLEAVKKDLEFSQFAREHLVKNLDAAISANHKLCETANADLEFMRNYIGLEARACILCTYKKGVFVRRCRMHADMEDLRGDLASARKCLADIVKPFETGERKIGIDTSDL